MTKVYVKIIYPLFNEKIRDFLCEWYIYLVKCKIYPMKQLERTTKYHF